MPISIDSVQSSKGFTENININSITLIYKHKYSIFNILTFFSFLRIPNLKYIKLQLYPIFKFKILKPIFCNGINSGFEYTMSEKTHVIIIILIMIITQDTQVKLNIIIYYNLF
jgi:hypothetical protein